MRSIISALEDAILKTRSLTERQITDFLFDRRNLTVAETDTESLYFYFDTSHPRALVTRFSTSSHPSESIDLTPGTILYTTYLDCVDLGKRDSTQYESTLLAKYSTVDTPTVDSTRAILEELLSSLLLNTRELVSYGWTPSSLGRFRYESSYLSMQCLIGSHLDGHYTHLSAFLDPDSLYPPVSIDHSIHSCLVNLFSNRLTLDTLPLLPPQTRDLLVKTGNHS